MKIKGELDPISGERFRTEAEEKWIADEREKLRRLDQYIKDLLQRKDYNAKMEEYVERLKRIFVNKTAELESILNPNQPNT